MSKDVKNGICKLGILESNSEILLNIELSGENDVFLSDCVGVDESLNIVEIDVILDFSSIKVFE